MTTREKSEKSVSTEESIPAKKTIEQWSKEKNTPTWLYAAAVAFNGWPMMKEVSEQEYLSALENAQNVKIGG